MTFQPTDQNLHTAVNEWCSSQSNGIQNFFSSNSSPPNISAHQLPVSGHGQNSNHFGSSWSYTSDTMTSQNSDAPRQSSASSQYYNNTKANWVSKAVNISSNTTNSYISFKYDISSESADKLQVVLRKLNTNTNLFDPVTWPLYSGGDSNIGYYNSGNIFTIYGAGLYTFEILFVKDQSVSLHRDNVIISEFRWVGYPHISTWDTSQITNMSNLFNGQTDFNDDIGNWNTNLVTDMSEMFNGATSFNQNIGSWNTYNVTNMYRMFNYALVFNNNNSSTIGNWNTLYVI